MICFLWGKNWTSSAPRSQYASRNSYDRPTRSRFSVILLSAKANSEFILKIHVALHASHAALANVIKISSQCYPPNTKFSPNYQLLSSAAYSNSPVPITLPPLLPNVLPCYQNIFTRRTSGHSLGTFTAAKFSNSPPHHSRARHTSYKGPLQYTCVCPLKHWNYRQ